MGSLLDSITARLSGLTRSERKIAAAVLADPARTAGENITTLALRAGVSEPTVYRFCRAFGADGFPAFRQLLSAELSSAHHQVSPGDSMNELTARVLDSAVSALKELGRTLDCRAAARAADLISKSRRLVVAAGGLSLPAAMFLQARMLSLGLSCEIVSDSTQLAQVSAVLRPGELLLAISATGQNRPVVQAVQQAVRGGAAVIALCPRDSALAACGGLNLYCSRADADGNQLQSPRLAQLAALEILISGVRQRRAETLRALEASLSAARESCYLAAEPAAADPAESQSQEDPANTPADHPPAFTWPY